MPAAAKHCTMSRFATEPCVLIKQDRQKVCARVSSNHRHAQYAAGAAHSRRSRHGRLSAGDSLLKQMLACGCMLLCHYVNREPSQHSRA